MEECPYPEQKLLKFDHVFPFVDLRLHYKISALKDHFLNALAHHVIIMFCGNCISKIIVIVVRNTSCAAAAAECRAQI